MGSILEICLFVGLGAGRHVISPKNEKKPEASITVF